MSELNKISCDRKGCNAEHLEEHFNQGYPGWGHVVGLVEPKMGENRVHLCPEHMNMIKELLNGGWDRDMG